MNILDDCLEEWFDVKAIEGSVKRHRHPGCSDGKDKALSVIKTQWGWHVSCWRCKQKGFKQAVNLSPEKTVKWQSAEENKIDQIVPDIKLPGDYTKKLPAAGLAWLYLCGITDSDILEYCIGYSQHRDRVILPIYEGEELVYWQGRYLGVPDVRHPKYVNQHKAGRKEIWFHVVGKGSDHVVVVEDILSCIVVGKTADCYALLNASVPDRLMFKLDKKYKKIFLWLDPDKATAMDTWLPRYQSFGIDTRIIKTDRDPKYYSKTEIEHEILKIAGG